MIMAMNNNSSKNNSHNLYIYIYTHTLTRIIAGKRGSSFMSSSTSLICFRSVSRLVSFPCRRLRPPTIRKACTRSSMTVPFKSPDNWSMQLLGYGGTLMLQNTEVLGSLGTSRATPFCLSGTASCWAALALQELAGHQGSGHHCPESPD